MPFKTVNFMQQPQISPDEIRALMPQLQQMAWLPQFQDLKKIKDEQADAEDLYRYGTDYRPTSGASGALGWAEGLSRLAAAYLGGNQRREAREKGYEAEQSNRDVLHDTISSNNLEDPNVIAALSQSPDPTAQALAKTLMARAPTSTDRDLLDIRREDLKNDREYQQGMLRLGEDRELNDVNADVTRTQQLSNQLAETRENNMRNYNLELQKLSPEYLQLKAEAELVARGGTGTRIHSSKDLGDGRILGIFDNGASGIFTDQGLKMIQGQNPLGNNPGTIAPPGAPVGIGDVPGSGGSAPSGLPGAPAVPGTPLPTTVPQQPPVQPPTPQPLASTNAPSAVQDRSLAQWRGKNQAEREKMFPQAFGARQSADAKSDDLVRNIDEILGAVDDKGQPSVDPKTKQPLTEEQQQGNDMIGFWSSGPAGYLMNSILGPLAPGGSYDLQQTLQTVQAAMGFDELQQMRENSPTGGALGQVTDQEIKYLQSMVENMNQWQTPALLRKNLLEVRRKVMEFKTMRQQAFERDYGDMMQGAIQPGIQGIGTPPGAPVTPQRRTREQILQQYGVTP